jgi:hypothetical protein
MTQTRKQFGAIAIALALVVSSLVLTYRSQPAFGAEQGGSGSGPHFTVLETEGHNLVVTDNATNTLYFYTVDKGQNPGADLKLRASVNLNDVGKSVIKPKDIAVQK